MITCMTEREQELAERARIDKANRYTGTPRTLRGRLTHDLIPGLTREIIRIRDQPSAGFDRALWFR